MTVSEKEKKKKEQGADGAVRTGLCRTAAVIAEYNPFHIGHAWQLREIRRRSGADFLVVLMSGDFVQRGVPAILNRHCRAEAALRCGADLVLELPCAAATGSAGRFAEGAVAVLNELKTVDELWFGSESGEISDFLRISEILAEEPAAFREKLAVLLKSGRSFPAARAEALEQYLQQGRSDPDSGRDLAACDSMQMKISDTSEPIGAEKKKGIPWQSDWSGDLQNLLSLPNNILGLEYCIALRKSGSRIRPRTIQRMGQDYHDASLTGPVCSAEAIRLRLRAYGEQADLQDSVPSEILPLFREQLKEEGILAENDFSLLLGQKLLQADRDFLFSCLDLSESMANRILKRRGEYRGFSDLAERLKTREMTRSAVNRCLLHILLDLTEEDFEQVLHPSFVRILGMKREAQVLLGMIHRAGGLQTIGKMSALPRTAYEKELYAAQLYELVRAGKAGQPTRNEYSRKFLVI